MTTMDSETKRKILQAFIARFEVELSVILESEKSAHEAAIHAENRAEDQHDTRGLEASYLAGAQAARAAEIRQVILEYRALLDAQMKPAKQVAAGALVTFQPLDDEGGKPKGREILSLIAVHGGGTTVEWEGKTISILTPTSPLGEAALGANAGDEVSIESKAGNRYYRIREIS